MSSGELFSGNESSQAGLKREKGRTEVCTNRRFLVIGS
jgi:hypothetical protein